MATRSAPTSPPACAPCPQILLLAQSFSGFAPRGGPAGVVAAQKFQLSAVYDVTASLSLQIGAIAAIGGVNSPAERGLISAVLVAILVGDRLDFDLGDASRSESEAVSRRD